MCTNDQIKRHYVRQKHKENSSDLAEETLAATASTCRKVDVDVVILGVDGFLDKRLVKDSAVDLDKIVRFHYIALCCSTSHRQNALITSEFICHQVSKLLLLLLLTKY